jgi:hypothetical protein
MYDKEKVKNRCISCGVLTATRYCETCAKSRKKTGGLPHMCAVCKVLEQCQRKPENMSSKCRQCGKVDRCNMVRNGLCLDCWIKERNKTNPMIYYAPTVDDYLTNGRNGR